MSMQGDYRITLTGNLQQQRLEFLACQEDQYSDVLALDIKFLGHLSVGLVLVKPQKYNLLIPRLQFRNALPQFVADFAM